MRRLVFLATLILSNCSSSESATEARPASGPATSEQLATSCSALCAAQKKCTPTFDEAACTTKCNSRSAASVGKTRADYVVAFTECVKTAACDKIESCTETVPATITPTPAVQTFCEALVKKDVACSTGVTEVATCVKTYKLLVDSALDLARPCLDKTCTEFETCMRSTLG